MDTPLQPSQPAAAAPSAVLDSLRAALTDLHALAAQPSADPFYAQAAEQVAAIVTELQSRAAPTTGLLPHPPSPG
jgi:hypothetical protein